MKTILRREKKKLRIDLAASIEKSLFNNLNYSFDETTLINLQDDNKEFKIYNCGFKPFSNEPDNTVLFYSKKIV